MRAYLAALRPKVLLRVRQARVRDPGHEGQQRPAAVPAQGLYQHRPRRLLHLAGPGTRFCGFSSEGNDSFKQTVLTLTNFVAHELSLEQSEI